jgi:hypothetical protein
MDWRAFLVGALGLALLDAVLTHRAGISNVTGAESGLITIVKGIVDPATPAFGPSVVASATSTKPIAGAGGGPSGPATNPTGPAPATAPAK